MQQFSSNKQKEKVYIAIVIVGLIASLMLFAGLSSAVLVRKMDKFWVILIFLLHLKLVLF